MRDRPLVQVGERPHQLPYEPAHLILRQPLMKGEMPVKGAMTHVLHAQVNALRRLEDLVQAHDVRVADALEHADLVFETTARGRVSKAHLFEGLDGDQLAGEALLRHAHEAEGALADGLA